MTEGTEQSEASEWLSGEPLPTLFDAADDDDWPAAQSPADTIGTRVTDGDDDWRRSKLEADRARRTADIWSEDLSAQVARLERRMETFIARTGGLDSNGTRPRKESS